MKALSKEGRRKYIGCKSTTHNVVTVISWRYIFWSLFWPLKSTNNATGREKMTDEREAKNFLKKIILDFEL